MIPQISQAPGVVQLVLNFLQELEQQGFTGDTATSYADRLTMSTDNSIYQLLPDAVVFPRSTADVALIARLAAQERYSSLIFTPRGGGTGTNGQALNQGIIVDMSRHMNRIIEINPEEGWVRVEAGVIKDQLNQYLKPFGRGDKRSTQSVPETVRLLFCAGTFDQQPGNARWDDQYRCIQSGIAGLWQNVGSRTWRTRGVVGGR